jgi:hypothetical protein
VNVSYAFAQKRFTGALRDIPIIGYPLIYARSVPRGEIDLQYAGAGPTTACPAIMYGADRRRAWQRVGRAMARSRIKLTLR